MVSCGFQCGAPHSSIVLQLDPMFIYIVNMGGVTSQIRAVESDISLKNN